MNTGIKCIYIHGKNNDIHNSFSSMHISENALSPSHDKFDAIIHNDKDIQSFINKIETFMAITGTDTGADTGTVDELVVDFTDL